MAEAPNLPPARPVPGGSMTLSELFPIGSTHISLLHSRALVPLLLTAVTCVVLFGFIIQSNRIQDYDPYLQVLAGFVVVMTFYALYVYSGETKSIFWYMIPAGITWWQLQHVFGYYAYVFRVLLPGETRGTRGFVATFVGHFFGAGLLEELLKASPILLALLITLAIRASGVTKAARFRGISLEGPLDGLLMGAVAGAAFIVDETVFDYVARTIKRSDDLGKGYFMGLALLIPRVMQGVVGHMAWTGIFGYFIGLSATHPRSAWKLIPLGWLLAASLHAFWNSVLQISVGFGLFLSIAVTLPIFLSCLVKARQLEASRLDVWPVGKSVLPPVPRPLTQAGVTLPPQGGFSGALTAVSTLLERSVGVRARTTSPLQPAGPVIPAPGLSIGSGALSYALMPGQIVDFSATWAAQAVPPGCTGLIGIAPDGGMTIRNAGTATWTVTGTNNAIATVPPGGSFRPMAGSRLALGGAAFTIQAY